MKNVYHKEIWRTGAVQIHMEPHPIPVIKSNNDKKSENDSIKIKLRRYDTSEKLDMYKLKWPCLTAENQRSSCSSIALDASGTLKANVNL